MKEEEKKRRQQIRHEKLEGKKEKKENITLRRPLCNDNTETDERKKARDDTIQNNCQN